MCNSGYQYRFRKICFKKLGCLFWIQLLFIVFNFIVLPFSRVPSDVINTYRKIKISFHEKKRWSRTIKERLEFMTFHISYNFLYFFALALRFMILFCLFVMHIIFYYYYFTTISLCSSFPLIKRNIFKNYFFVVMS